MWGGVGSKGFKSLREEWPEKRIHQLSRCVIFFSIEDLSFGIIVPDIIIFSANLW